MLSNTGVVFPFSSTLKLAAFGLTYTLFLPNAISLSKLSYTLSIDKILSIAFAYIDIP